MAHKVALCPPPAQASVRWDGRVVMGPLELGPPSASRDTGTQSRTSLPFLCQTTLLPPRTPQVPQQHAGRIRGARGRMNLGHSRKSMYTQTHICTHMHAHMYAHTQSPAYDYTCTHLRTTSFSLLLLRSHEVCRRWSVLDRNRPGLQESAFRIPFDT